MLMIINSDALEGLLNRWQRNFIIHRQRSLLLGRSNTDPRAALGYDQHPATVESGIRKVRAFRQRASQS